MRQSISFYITTQHPWNRIHNFRSPNSRPRTSLRGTVVPLLAWVQPMQPVRPYQ
jgi:hypothetical protein